MALYMILYKPSKKDIIEYIGFLAMRAAAVRMGIRRRCFMKRLMLTALLAAGMFVLSGCAALQPSPQDLALKERVRASIAGYTDVQASVSGGRVYLEGWVENFPEREDVLTRVKAIPGVTNVMDDLRLKQPGPDGGGDASSGGRR